MWPKYKQPFIGTWSLPSGKVHYDDHSVHSAVLRELSYIISREPVTLEHRGVVEINTTVAGDLVTHVLEHIFVATIDVHTIIHTEVAWMTLEELSHAECSPGTREVIEHCLANEPFYYHHYDIAW